MESSVINQVKVRLPYELRLLIYSYTFLVNFEPFERLGLWREYSRKHGIPPQAAFLRDEAYLSYRKRGRIFEKSPTAWPDENEETLFKAIEWTHAEGAAHFTRMEDILIGGSEAVNLLQTGALSLRYPWTRHEVISDIFLALTGRRVSQNVVSFRFRMLRKYSGRFLQVPCDRSCDIVYAIASLIKLKPVLVHDALYHLLHDDILVIGNDMQALELITKTIPSCFQSSMKRIMLFYDPGHLARTLQLLRTRGSPFALETVYIRLHSGISLFLFSAPPDEDNIYKVVQRIMAFKLSIQSINSRTSVVLLEESTPMRAMARGEHTKVLTINATEYLSMDTPAIDTSVLGLQSGNAS